MAAEPVVPVLIRFDNNPRRFDLSPWVNRLEALLTFSRTTFELDKTRGNGRAAPRGKLPVIKLPGATPGTDDEIIPDSLFAYEALVKRELANELDVGLDAEGLAKSRAIQSLIEENYNIMTKERWIDQIYYARDQVALRALAYPIRLAVGYYLYRDISARVVAWGLARPEVEIDRLRDTGIDALATFVGDKKHVLGGDAPTRADALIFAYIAAIRTNPKWVPKLATSLHAHPNLLTYAEGLRQTWFPDRQSFV